MPLKLSEFDTAAPLDGSELVGIVQGAENAQTTTADVAALAVGGAANAEFIRDTMGTALLAGTNITVTVDDPGNTITIAGTITDETIRDMLATAFTDSGLVVVAPNDGADTIDIGVPAAVAADLNTGTDTAKAVTSDALAGSIFGEAVFVLQVTDPAGSALTTGDGKAYFQVPLALNGMNLVKAEGGLTTVSSSGIPTVQVANVTDAVDMLSTKLTIDANEFNSSTAAAAAVVDGTKDDVATGDLLRIDCDVAGTGAKGLMVILTFQLP